MANDQEAVASGLSCEVVRMALTVADPDLNISGGKSELQAAAAHYAGCNECRELGMSAITDRKMTCQEAILIWARRLGPLWLDVCRTVREAIASEHVWGRQIGVEGTHYNGAHYSACAEPLCTALRYYWMEAPLSSGYDGAYEVALEIPILVSWSLRAGWLSEDFSKLLAIWRERLRKLRGCICVGKIPSEDSAHYYRIEDVEQELQIGLDNLFDLVRYLRNPPAADWMPITGGRRMDDFYGMVCRLK